MLSRPPRAGKAQVPAIPLTDWPRRCIMIHKELQRQTGLCIRWSIGDEKMLINECPRCTQCCEKGRIQERIKIKWKALYKGEDESYVAACKNCKRLYFIPFWTLIVQAISDMLVLPWVLAPALFSKSIYIYQPFRGLVFS